MASASGRFKSNAEPRRARPMSLASPRQEGMDENASQILAQAVPLDATVFLMGCALPLVAAPVRARAERRHSTLGSLLAPTPPVWVRLPELRIGRRLVSNGEYREFLRATTQGTGETGAIYDGIDLWRQIWKGLGYRIDHQRVWLQRSDGPPASMDERYGQFDNFIEAYVESLRLETIRVLAGPSASLEPAISPGNEVIRVHTEEGETFASLKRDPLIDRVFAAIAAQFASLSRERSQTTRRLGKKPVLDPAELDELIGKLAARVEAASVAQPQIFGRPGTEGEPLTFLVRYRTARSEQADEPILLHDVLYPRLWPEADGEARPFFPGPDVAWEDRPGLGVTLYEALAFTVWLSAAATKGEIVTLPTEAELERAASWPADRKDDQRADGPPLDSSPKDIFPWQRRSELDFHDYFGGESKELQHYMTSRSEYERLVEATSRPARDDRIEMLLGFGWHWTADRFDEDERRYSRFADGACPRAFERPRKEGQSAERTAPVFG